MHLVSSSNVVCWHLEDTRGFYASILLSSIITASEVEVTLPSISNIPSSLSTRPMSVLAAATPQHSKSLV